MTLTSSDTSEPLTPTTAFAMAMEAVHKGDSQEADRLFAYALSARSKLDPRLYCTFCARYVQFLVTQRRLDYARRWIKHMAKVADKGDGGAIWTALDAFLRHENEGAACRLLRETPLGYYVHPWRLMRESENFARSGQYKIGAALAQLAIDSCAAKRDHANRLRAEGQLGRVYEHEGRIEDAIAVWEGAFWEGTANRIVADRLTLHLIRQGRDEECVRVVEEALTRIRDCEVLDVLSERREQALRRIAARRQAKGNSAD